MCYFATCTILDAILQCVMQSLAISSLWLSLLSFIAFIVVPLFFELTAPQVSSWFVWSTGVVRENKHPPVEFVADRSNHFSSRLFDKFSSMYWWRQKMKKKRRLRLFENALLSRNRHFNRNLSFCSWTKVIVKVWLEIKLRQRNTFSPTLSSNSLQARRLWKTRSSFVTNENVSQ